jgi:sugar/nucleoside kinase (ribokinase family)
VPPELRHPAIDVAVIGSATMDRIVLADRAADKIGGVAVYAGLTFRKHGLETAVLANIAAGDLRHFRVMEEAGLRLVAGPTAATTRFVNRETAGGRVQEMPAAADPIRRVDALAAMHSIRHIHLGPLHPDDIHPDLLAYVKRGNYFVSLDAQGYVRRIRNGRVEAAVSQRLGEVLSFVDVVKASEEELRLILEWSGTDVRTLQARFGFGGMLVTAGAGGGYLAGQNGEVTRYDSVRAEAVEDPTGAGDVFFAAYLAGRRHEGWTEAEALAHAARIAALHVEGRYIPKSVLEIRLEGGDPIGQ